MPELVGSGSAVFTDTQYTSIRISAPANSLVLVFGTTEDGNTGGAFGLSLSGSGGITGGNNNWQYIHGAQASGSAAVCQVWGTTIQEGWENKLITLGPYYYATGYSLTIHYQVWSGGNIGSYVTSTPTFAAMELAITTTAIDRRVAAFGFGRQLFASPFTANSFSTLDTQQHGATVYGTDSWAWAFGMHLTTPGAIGSYTLGSAMSTNNGGYVFVMEITDGPASNNTQDSVAISSSSTFKSYPYATLDFGEHPGSNEASCIITDQSGILSTSEVEAYWMADDFTIDHPAADHRYAPDFIQLVCTDIVPGVGFTIYGRSFEKLTGTFRVRWVWA